MGSTEGCFLLLPVCFTISCAFFSVLGLPVETQMHVCVVAMPEFSTNKRLLTSSVLHLFLSPAFSLFSRVLSSSLRAI